MMPTPASTRAPRVLAQMMKRIKESDHEPLRALVDEYLVKRTTAIRRYSGHAIDMNEKPRPGGRLSPSGVYGCQRQAVFKFTGIKGAKRIDPDQELLFEDGHWRHHKWQFMFYDMELVLGRDRFRVISIEDFVIIPDLYVAGSLDAEIAIKQPNGKWRRYIVDFKGINDRGFRWATTTAEAKEDNKRQLQCYMKARRVKRGILLYDNKNTNVPWTYTVPYGDDLWAETVVWIEKVLQQLHDKRLPPKDHRCRPGTMMYEGCLFRKLCWGSKDATDLQDIAFARSHWSGIDDAWNRSLELQGGLT